MKKLLKSFILFVVAIFLSCIFFPLGVAYSTIKFIIRFVTTLKVKECLDYISDFLYSIASSIDQTGCVVCQDLFNDTLIKKGASKFGHEDEKISSVIGKAEDRKLLTKVGFFLRNVLNFLDKDHAFKSIDKTIDYLTK